MSNTNLKLNALIPETLRRMEEKILEENFLKFLADGKENHWYVKDYETWAAAICRTAIYSPGEICDMYRGYGCNDTHVAALIKHCMKRKGWL